MNIRVDARIEEWPIAGQFVIARGAKSSAVLVVVSLCVGGVCGCGECTPYARYGETPEQVLAAIRSQTNLLQRSVSVACARAALNEEMPPGAARNALDCALWDLEAKLTGAPVWRLARLDAPQPVTTAFTISLGSPNDMASAAMEAQERPLLKLKLGGRDAARIASVRAAAPAKRLIVDANESWTPETWSENVEACVAARIEMIEQPFPADADQALAGIPRPIPVCADESAHDALSIEKLANRYDAVNVKLDKTGGLSGALAAIRAARAQGMSVMLGCMVGTSLSIAPALLLANLADIVDLDGPLLLRNDRKPGISYTGSTVQPASRNLWGSP